MPDKSDTRRDKNQNRDANPDPITGAPGSHPVGTGVGAAAGGAAGVGAGIAAGAAAGTAGAGPIGGAIGAAVGAVAGGLAGKGVAEHVNPTAEDEYWREHYSNEPYHDRTYSYDDYRAAYRTGYQGYSRLGKGQKRYEDVEPELRRDYERNYGTSRLSWDKAQPAVRAAWHRVFGSRGSDRGTERRTDRDLEQYIGYDVVDRNNNKIGTLDCIWTDHTGEPAFVGIRTGWFIGKTHVVPAQSVEVNDRDQRLRLPYSEDKVKEAPAYDAEDEMSKQMEGEVYQYYGLNPSGTGAGMTDSTTARTGSSSSMAGSTSGMAGSASNMTGAARSNADLSRGTARPETVGPGQRRDEATMQLSEEQLRVNKREVEAGGVRLRKVIRTQVVNQPVELRREEIVIERVPANQARAAGRAAFEEQEVYIPLRREEAVVEKETRVREEVHARKESQTNTENVSDRVRREDIEIERTGEAKERTPGTPGSRKP